MSQPHGVNLKPGYVPWYTYQGVTVIHLTEDILQLGKIAICTLGGGAFNVNFLTCNGIFSFNLLFKDKLLHSICLDINLRGPESQKKKFITVQIFCFLLFLSKKTINNGQS